MMTVTSSQVIGRPNRAMAEVVQKGLEMLDTKDASVDVAAYLEDRGVPFSVIVRVLRDPDHRRFDRSICR